MKRIVCDNVECDVKAGTWNGRWHSLLLYRTDTGALHTIAAVGTQELGTGWREVFTGPDMMNVLEGARLVKGTGSYHQAGRARLPTAEVIDAELLAEMTRREWANIVDPQSDEPARTPGRATAMERGAGRGW